MDSNNNENKFELSPEEFKALCHQVIPQRWQVVESDKGLWNNLRNVPAIDRLWNDFMAGNKRFFLIPSGRRAFKTEIADLTPEK